MQRSVRAVKARAVTVEAKRRVGLVVLYAAVCDYEAAGGDAEKRKRSRGDGGCGSERTGGEADEAIAAVYTYVRAFRPRSNINSTRQGAPNLPESADAFGDPWTSERDNNLLWFCFATSVRAGFGRCFDGETHPSSTKDLKQTSPFRASRRISDRQQLAAVPVHASRWYGCNPEANAGTEATVEARMLQRTSPVC